MKDLRERLYISTTAEDAPALAREHGLGLEIADFCTAYNMDVLFAEKDAAVSAGDLIPVIRVQPDQVFEVTNSASLSGVNIGAKVTLHASNGLQITGTTSSGVAELVYKEADAAGSRCLVRFP